MNFLYAEIKQKKLSKIIGVPLWPPSSPDHNLPDYTIWGVLENKTNETSHPNIGFLKTAIEEEWNKLSEELILKGRKSFWKCVDTIIEEMAALFTVSCLSSYFVAFKNQLCYIIESFIIILEYSYFASVPSWPSG